MAALFDDGDVHPVRRRWRVLTDERLPGAAAAAAAKGAPWPIHLDHCFARILLDNAVGAVWYTRFREPAWLNAPLDTLERAIALGEGVLSGAEDIFILNRRSLAMRGKDLSLADIERDRSRKQLWEKSGR